MKILLCASEVVPFAKTGGLADVAGALPKTLAAMGHDVRLVLPKYGAVDEKRVGAKKIIEQIKVPVADRRINCAVWLSEVIPGVKTYLIDNARLFGQKGLYGQPNDPERFVFYQRAALAMLDALDWMPEIIHCNDWQSGLIPLYLSLERQQKSPLAKVATVHTVHNLGYQGNFGREALRTAGLPESYFAPDQLEFYGQVSFMKAGLLYSDIISTVSPTYAQEIQTPEYGERLEGVMAMRKERLRGILNGLDYDVWNPAKDSFLAARYDAKDAKGKASCKTALQKRLGLEQSDKPVIGIISRLAAQKGFDLVEAVLPYLLKMQAQMVVLGVGDKPYEDMFKQAAADYPKQVSVSLEFNEELAHQIYAGSDMFLMPSRYEPCGLGQLISLRYGSIPVVRATGGLADTVEDYDAESGEGNGFSFKEYCSTALMATLARALLAYKDKKVWQKLVKRGMTADFSWQASAKRYTEVYKEAIGLVGKS